MTTALPPPMAVRPPRTRRVTRRFATLGARSRATAVTTREYASSASPSLGRASAPPAGRPSAMASADSTKRTLDMKRMYQAVPRGRGRPGSGQPRPLDAPGDDPHPLGVAVAVARRLRRRGVAGPHPAQLDAAVGRDERPRRTVVAVQRDAHAARVEQLDRAGG